MACASTSAFVLYIPKDARQVLNLPDGCIISVIVGIVDSVEISD